MMYSWSLTDWRWFGFGLWCNLGKQPYFGVRLGPMYFMALRVRRPR